MEDVSIKMFYKATYISKAFFPQKMHTQIAQVGSKKFGPKTSLIAKLDSSLIPCVNHHSCHHLYTIRCFMKSVDICCCILSTQEKKRKFICTHRFASKQLHHYDIHRCFHAQMHQSICIIIFVLLSQDVQCFNKISSQQYDAYCVIM